MIATYVRAAMLATVTLAAAFAASAQPVTLKDAAQEAVLRNPEVLSRWHAYQEATEGVDVARGGFRPRVDLAAGVTRKHTEAPNVPDRTFTERGISLYLNQMLYDGFATRSEVKRLNYAQRVRYFELLDASENIALEAMRAYNDVLRYRKLYKLAEDNYVQHRAVYEQIQRRVRAGVGKRVDLEQASGRLALAESNLLTEASNLHDVSARYQRIVGTLPPAEMVEPDILKNNIPKRAVEAIRVAYQGHPALQAAQENIVSTKAEAEGRRAKFRPRVDLQARKDFGWDTDGIKGRSDAQSIGLLLNYNLYNGGSDQAAERQFWKRVEVARDLRDKVCRDIRQTLTIAHNDVNKLTEQLNYLDQHQLSTEKARDAYRQQFDIGQRTLLDLLDTENELFEARRAYTAALHDFALAHARTQAGMGQLLGAIGLQRLETDRLAEQREQAEFDPNTVCPLEDVGAMEIDKDRIFAAALAANPELLPPDAPVEPMPDRLAPRGSALPPAAPAVALDSDGDGVPDDKDACPGTEAGVKVDAQGCPLKPVIELKGVTFRLNSAILEPDSMPILNDSVAMLERYPDLKVEIGGHTCNLGGPDYNLRLSDRRARSVLDYFVSKGIDPARLSSRGYGLAQPVAENTNEAGRRLNRRVELKILD